MKKLLALILCVMLFVSVIPTSAFAAVDIKTASGWAPKKDSADAVDAAKDAIKSMYIAIAVDETVFSTAKAMYNFSNNLAESLFADTESVKAPGADKATDHDDLVKNTRKYLNSIIGAEINTYLTDKAGRYTNKDGTYNPEKYMKVYAEAASKALGSEKAQKGIEAIALALMASNLQSDIFDRADDLRDAIDDWGAGKWAEFGTFGDFTADPFELPVLGDVTASDLDDAASIAFIFAS